MLYPGKHATHAFLDPRSQARNSYAGASFLTLASLGCKEKTAKGKYIIPGLFFPDSSIQVAFPSSLPACPLDWKGQSDMFMAHLHCQLFISGQPI